MRSGVPGRTSHASVGTGPMLIVHIGFGKTGTTSLQRNVFSRLVGEGLVDAYNPSEIAWPLEFFRRGDRSQIPLLRDYLATTRRLFISMESLIGWNPGDWPERFEMNREILPSDARILITMRDPEAYLRSAYQQNVAQGNVRSEAAFFLTQEDYRTAQLIARPRIAEIFSVDDFSYRAVLGDYAGAFERTIAAPISAIDDLGFLPALGIEASPEQLERLRAAMRAGAVENRSFSATAMALTLWRERWLNAFGLQSRHVAPLQNSFAAVNAEWKAERSAAQRLVARLPSWRTLMTRGLDRVAPYRRFELGADTPRGRHHADNQRLYAAIQNSPGGFLRLDRGQRPPPFEEAESVSGAAR